MSVRHDDYRLNVANLPMAEPAPTALLPDGNGKKTPLSTTLNLFEEET